jgi:DNA-binding NarL/FixJ family response regulator
MIKLAIVDDHELIRKGIVQALDKNGVRVLIEAENGQDFISKLTLTKVEIVLMDVNMPVMDGITTTSWIRQNHPEIQVIALSVFDDDINVIRMLKAGARAYVLKNSRIKEIINAISDVHSKGFHFSDRVSIKLLDRISATGNDSDTDLALSLNEREIDFLKLCCTEKTYKEIAVDMHMSPRTAEGYGKSLCDKLGVKSRVGLVLFAIKNNIAQI